MLESGKGDHVRLNAATQTLRVAFFMRISLESAKKDKDNRRDLFFKDPLEIISCNRLSDIKIRLLKLEEALSSGFYLAGFLSYEAGYAFEEKLRQDKNYDFPLLYFGVFESPQRPEAPQGTHQLSSPKPDLGLKAYKEYIQKIKEHIRRGDTYQVNYTFKYLFDLKGSPRSLYERLRSIQPTPYSALIEAPDFSVISLSPELFFRKKGDLIEVKPMKGTAALNCRPELKTPKNRAENLMIVDLLRNDLGRVSETGSVQTKKLFEIERYRTLFQMTSLIQSRLDQNLSLFDLFSAIFPSGSVTGAPKIRTMQIIRELEKEERRIYTGSIGYVTPQGDAVFNVAIRTLLIREGRGELGVGGGITIDSDPQKEYDECRLKAGFLLK